MVVINSSIMPEILNRPFKVETCLFSDGNVFMEVVRGRGSWVSGDFFVSCMFGQSKNSPLIHTCKYFPNPCAQCVLITHT